MESYMWLSSSQKESHWKRSLLPVCFCLTSVKRHRLAYTGNPLGIQYFYTNFGTG